MRPFFYGTIKPGKFVYIKIMPFGIMKFLLALAVLMLVGCTMRPPSASAFMSAYQAKKDSSGAACVYSLSKYVAFTPDSATMEKAGYEREDWDDVVAKEWTVDINTSLHYFINHFEIGAGFQWFNPYVTMGFASDYFGIMGWTDWRIMARLRSAGIGVSIMEQILPTPKMQIGLIQFVSQSWGYYFAGGGEWLEAYRMEYSPEGEPLGERPDYDGICEVGTTSCSRKTVNDVAEPYPYGFREVGAGAYMLNQISNKIRMSFEFRYSYDWIYKAKRLAFTLNCILG